jgi:hypothetical protein
MGGLFAFSTNDGIESGAIGPGPGRATYCSQAKLARSSAKRASAINLRDSGLRMKCYRDSYGNRTESHDGSTSFPHSLVGGQTEFPDRHGVDGERALGVILALIHPVVGTGVREVA